MHDLLYYAINHYSLLPRADDASAGSDSFKVALVVTSGVVISALFGFLGITFNKKTGTTQEVAHHDQDTSHNDQTDSAYVIELKRRATAAETQCDAHEVTITELRNYLWSHGVNPYTFKPVGDSSAPSV